MGGDVVVNGPGVVVVTAILGTMSGIIVALYKLLIGRLQRAETQVDTGIASIEKIAEAVDKTSTLVIGNSTKLDSVAQALATNNSINDQILARLTALEKRRN